MSVAAGQGPRWESISFHPHRLKYPTQKSDLVDSSSVSREQTEVVDLCC